MNAIRLPNGHIRLFGDMWSTVFPPSQLPDQIAFYERMAEKYGRDYGATAEALRKVQE